MNRGLRAYLGLVLVLVLGWLWLRAPVLTNFGHVTHWLSLLGVVALYLCSHVLRMMRLILLTLDERDKALPLIAAHTLTAFPSSFLPFKIGELLRLAAFLRVYDGRRKAVAVWLTERFGDLVVIASFILCLYLLNISVPPTMRTVFMIFILASLLGILSLFAVAKVFVYLNRHLVLTSHSARGLLLLRYSHALRLLELDISKSVEGRLAGFLLLSVLTWALEIFALALFINQLTNGEPDLPALFAASLLASLPGAGATGLNAFGLYQSLALVALTLVFICAVWLAARFKHLRA
jgi:hypothetical protein